MPIKGCLERVAQDLLSPEKRLNPKLFDDNDVMLEDVRKSLLEFAQMYIDAVYGKFENTVIKEISLVGSQASYFYHDKSDIDLVIDILGEDNKYLTSDYKRYFHKYLANIVSEWLPFDSQSFWKGINVEVSPDRFKHKYSPQYSLLRNCWIFKFDTDLIKDIRIQDVADAYYNKLIDMADVLTDIENSNKSAKEKNNLLYDYYKSLLFDMRNDTYLTNIVYKILRSQNQIQNLSRIVALNNLKRVNSLTSGNREEPSETIEDTATRLLSPNNTLSSFIFDAQEIMHDDIRTKLLAAANIVFEHTVGKLDGAKIKDICLIGSMADYSYRADSDIDIAIIVDLKNCPYIKLKDDIQTINFLTEVYAANVDTLPQFQINGKMVDITLKANFSHEQYSLLQNKWLKKPEKNPCFDIDIQKLTICFYDELKNYANFMKQLKITNNHYSIKDCKKIRNRLIQRMNSDNDDNPRNYLTYRLTSQQGLIKLFANNMCDSFNFALSLPGAPKD